MEPPRGTKRPLPGTAADDGGGGTSSRGDTGFLDESGSFVERAARGGTKEDAWLGPADTDAPASPAATKRARKALRKQEGDERLVEDLVSARAVFEIQKRVIGILWPGETVPRALRRLKESGQTEGGFPGTASTSRTRGGSSSRMDEATRRAFDELTDAAADLLARGDLDAYSHDREAFERAAWVYEYRRRARASGSAAQEVEEEYGADRTAAGASRNYVDMFGDDEVDSDGTGVKTAADSAGGQAVNPDQRAEAEEGGEGSGAAGWDYVYDPASGYYYSGSTGYYYDAASGYYCSASTGTWFSYDDDGGQSSGTANEM